MRTTDLWISYAAAVSTLRCSLLCSDGGDGSVISVSRAGDLSPLVTTERVVFASLQEAGITGT